MAVTIIGGQLLCLLLTLLITPVVYSYFDDMREWKLADFLEFVLRWLRLRRRPEPETGPTV
jgi:hypothetical protein